MKLGAKDAVLRSRRQALRALSFFKYAAAQSHALLDIGGGVLLASSGQLAKGEPISRRSGASGLGHGTGITEGTEMI